eukprot:4011360-Prymnesium_polylepis.1
MPVAWAQAPVAARHCRGRVVHGCVGACCGGGAQQEQPCCQGVGAGLADQPQACRCWPESRCVAPAFACLRLLLELLVLRK